MSTANAGSFQMDFKLVSFVENIPIGFTIHFCKEKEKKGRTECWASTFLFFSSSQSLKKSIFHHKFVISQKSWLNFEEHTESVTDMDKLFLIKSVWGGLVFDSSQFSLLYQLPQKNYAHSKLVKSDSKVIISLCWSITWHTL